MTIFLFIASRYHKQFLCKLLVSVLAKCWRHKSLDMGLSNTFQSMTVIPLLLISDLISRKPGHPNVQTLRLSINFILLLGTSFYSYPKLKLRIQFCSSRRLRGYSYLKDPGLSCFNRWMRCATTFHGLHIAYANEP